MRSLSFGSTSLIALCLVLATGCSKDGDTKPEKKNATLPKSEASRGPGAHAARGGRGPNAAGGPGATDANRPRNGGGPGAKAAGAKGSPQPANAGKPGGSATPAAPPAEYVFGDFVGLASNDKGDSMLCELSLEQGANGGLRGRLNIPALRKREVAITPKIQGDNIRINVPGPSGPSVVSLTAAGAGKSLLGSISEGVAADAARFSIDLRRAEADTDAVTTNEYTGTLAMAQGEVDMTLSVSTLARGDQVAYALLPSLQPEAIVLRQPKIEAGGITAIWEMGVSLGSLALEATDDGGLEGSWKVQGKDRKITLTKAPPRGDAHKPSTGGTDTDDDAAKDG